MSEDLTTVLCSWADATCSSTTLGSIALAENYRASDGYAYATTKAALNMLTLQWALQYEDKGFIFTAISPGVRDAGLLLIHFDQ
jgi:NAD(P)-dependent dehydrogenase (short-subunit alcohol dehydrogenase family)